MLRILLITLCIGVAAAVHSQDSLGGFIFNKLDQKKSLFDFQVSFLHQDQKGFLWMSSNTGFYRYNGKKAILYRPNNLKHSFNPIVNSNVFEDRQGNHWFSTVGGLHRVDQQSDTVASFQVYCEAEKRYLQATKLFYLHPKQNDEELWIYNDSTWYKASLKNPTKATPYRKLVPELWRIIVIKDINNKLTAIAGSFLGYGFYLHYFDAKRNNTTSRLKEHLIANILNEADSVLWIASMSGLLQYDLKRDLLKKTFLMPNDKEGVTDVNLWESKKLLLTTTQNNNFQFDKTRNSNSGLASLESWKKIEGQYQKISTVNKTLIDNWDNLWIASWETGLYYTNLKKTYFKHLVPDKQSFISGQYSVVNMVTDRTGKLWTVIKEGTIFKVYTATNGNNLKLMTTDSDPLILIPDPQRSVWVAKADSLKKFDNNRWVAVLKCNQPIREIDLTPDGNALARTDTSFIYCNLRSNTWKSLPLVGYNQMDISTINTVFVDKKGYCFINCRTSDLLVFKLHQQHLEFISEYKDLGRANHMIEDKNRMGYWIASSNGLFRIEIGKKHSIENLSKEHNDLNQSFIGVLQDREGKLWLSTTDNIFCFSPKTKKTQQFSESDGTLGGQYNMGVCAQSNASQLFFGGTNGVNVIEPDHLVLDKNIPPLFCEQILVNGQTWKQKANVEKLSDWKFEADERNLTFIFSTLDYISPAENQFKYRLKKQRFWDKLFGSEEGNWVNLGPNNVLTIADLSKGKYKLEVIASNSDGIWRETNQAKQYSFYVKPYWYETTWAMLLFLLLITGLSYRYYQYRIYLIHQKAQLTDTELKVLRLQMNPHFIYNCLASIQRYVIVAKVEQANGLITSFAKLMRKILTDSVKSNLFIAEEIELLESYLLTESLRFEDKFEYTIAIDPLLDPEEVAIPAMIMQPFVENAIIHGMAKLDGKGHIRVFFGLNEGMLECSVEDNGVGFSKSLNRAHESKAIEITERRLKLLPKTGKEAASLTFVDLKEQDPNLSGVRIVIRLPLHLHAS